MLAAQDLRLCTHCVVMLHTASMPPQKSWGGVKSSHSEQQIGNVALMLPPYAAPPQVRDPPTTAATYSGATCGKKYSIKNFYASSGTL
jgi:hypothetical protein